MHPFRLVCVLGASVLLAPVLLARSLEPTSAIPLGVQSCDTQCQSTETDCDLACDQVVACVEECKKTSASCVEKCRSAPAPGYSAKPPDQPVPAGSAKAPGAKKPTTEKKPVPPAKAPAKPPAK